MSSSLKWNFPFQFHFTRMRNICVKLNTGVCSINGIFGWFASSRCICDTIYDNITPNITLNVNILASFCQELVENDEL